MKLSQKEESNMPRLTVNPQAEVSVGFPTFKAGTYSMRIVKAEDRNPEKNDIKITLAYIDPSQLILLDNSSYTGTLEAAGSLFDYLQLAEDKQWKLRTVTEAAGLPWADYDPCVDLVGREVQVKVILEEYQGEQKNKVGRYVIPKR